MTVTVNRKRRVAVTVSQLWWVLLAGLSITPPGSFSDKADSPMPTASAGIGAATTEEEVEKMRGALDRMKFSFTSYSHEVMQELRDGGCLALSTN